jgi:hypothetical protein
MAGESYVQSARWRQLGFHGEFAWRIDGRDSVLAFDLRPVRITGFHCAADTKIPPAWLPGRVT